MMMLRKLYFNSIFYQRKYIEIQVVCFVKPLLVPERKPKRQRKISIQQKSPAKKMQGFLSTILNLFQLRKNNRRATCTVSTACPIRSYIHQHNFFTQSIPGHFSKLAVVTGYGGQ